MNVHWLQHAPFEGLGSIKGWLLERGHTLSCTRLYDGEALPQDCAGFEWLIVMGGPMNVYQYRDHPWLKAEKELIGEAVSSGRRVLGVCLGAQLIADRLGGKVYQNGEREIGWFGVKGREAGSSPFAFPAETLAFHWHGDTFSLPSGSVWLAESEACAHQAFSVGKRVLGLQFHLEMSAADIGEIVQGCAGELTPGKFVQSAQAMLEQARKSGASAQLDRLLTALEKG